MAGATFTKAEVNAQIQQIMNSGVDYTTDTNSNPILVTKSVGSHQQRVEALLVLIAGILSDMNTNDT